MSAQGPISQEHYSHSGKGEGEARRPGTVISKEYAFSRMEIKGLST